MPERLTETYVKQLKYDGKPFIVRDTKVIGFMVAVNKQSKSYKIQRDLWEGSRGRRKLIKTVRHTIGAIDEISLEDARARAVELLEMIRRGTDPNASADSSGDDASAWTVGRLYEEYVKDLRARDCSERTVSNVQDRLDRYLSHWKAIPITKIKRSMARQEHQRITDNHGGPSANKTLRDFRAAYNFALRVVDDPDTLQGNPVEAVTFNKERASNKVIQPEDLAYWWKRVRALHNPLRKEMHTLGLLSGLRPGTLVSLKQEWVSVQDHAISIPRMKSGRAFDLPLSNRMVELVQRALDISNTLFPDAEFIFPTRSTKNGDVIATQVWKEKTLPSETGHILRHTYRTIAQRIGIDPINARLLMDHSVPGIDGVYIHKSALFDKLLEDQERMTEGIFSLLEPNHDFRLGS